MGQRKGTVEFICPAENATQEAPDGIGVYSSWLTPGLAAYIVGGSNSDYAYNSGAGSVARAYIQHTARLVLNYDPADVYCRFYEPLFDAWREILQGEIPADAWVNKVSIELRIGAEPDEWQFSVLEFDNDNAYLPSVPFDVDNLVFQDDGSHPGDINNQTSLHTGSVAFDPDIEFISPADVLGAAFKQWLTVKHESDDSIPSPHPIVRASIMRLFFEWYAPVTVDMQGSSSIAITAQADQIENYIDMAGAASMSVTGTGNIVLRGALRASLPISFEAIGDLFVYTPSEDLTNDWIQFADDTDAYFADDEQAEFAISGYLNLYSSGVYLTIDADATEISRMRNLSASIGISLEATANIGRKRSMQGAASLAVTSSARLTKEGSLYTNETSCVLSITASPALVRQRNIAGSASISMTAQSDIQVTVTLAGGASMTMTAQGTLGGYRNMAANLPITIDLTADLLREGNMSGSALLALLSDAAITYLFSDLALPERTMEMQARDRTMSLDAPSRTMALPKQ